MTHCFGVCSRLVDTAPNGKGLTQVILRVYSIHMTTSQRILDITTADIDLDDIDAYADYDFDPWAEAEMSYYDDDPSPYDGTYSEC